MFSGKEPFYRHVAEMSVALAVVGGRRPGRPSDDISAPRGLTDELWRLIGTFWNHDQAQRPPASKIVSDLSALPNVAIDTRALNDFDTGLPSSYALHTKDSHPFSALAPNSAEDSVEMERLKRIY